MNLSRLSWGILGTGRIARTLAKALAASRTGRLAAVASREMESARRFAADFPGTRPHCGYEALLADPEVQAVYIATPHALHAEWAIRAARAGKHLLCEKPVALNYPEAMAVAEAVRRHGVFFMEAFMYRAHPQTAKIVEIIRSGRLGKIRLIEAGFAFGASCAAGSRLNRQELGGGAILDVGCYCASMARLLAGAALGLPFAEPAHVKAFGALEPQSGVDVQAVALLAFENGPFATLSTGINGRQANRVAVHGTEGRLTVPEPWLPGETSVIELETAAGGREVIGINADSPLYVLEVDAVAASLAAKEAPCMTLADTLGNMAVLDRWRKEIGLLYRQEAESAARPPLPPLRPAGSRAVPDLCRPAPGLDRPVSRMVMGTDLGGAILPAPHAFALFDYFAEHGGNCFDTAYVYGGGAGERLLGQWMRQRGVRKETVLIAKGAHTPHCNPDAMLRQFDESLERLQTDYADLYLLHRDNLEIPVGEFVDALNTLLAAGRVKVFGGSNWTLERVAEANQYAAKHGLRGFGAVSNQFSLARMVDPVWAGCVSSGGPAWREWLTGRQMPLFAWSSQARGFFVRGAESFLGDAELSRCWYASDNFERLRRVQTLARKRGVEPVQIAAAYVLHQPFPLFALVGPRSLSELASCFEAFGIALSPEEAAWLNLARD